MWGCCVALDRSERGRSLLITTTRGALDSRGAVVGLINDAARQSDLSQVVGMHAAACEVQHVVSVRRSSCSKAACVYRMCGCGQRPLPLQAGDRHSLMCKLPAGAGGVWVCTVAEGGMDRSTAALTDRQQILVLGRVHEHGHAHGLSTCMV